MERTFVNHCKIVHRLHSTHCNSHVPHLNPQNSNTRITFQHYQPPTIKRIANHSIKCQSVSPHSRADGIIPLASFSAFKLLQLLLLHGLHYHTGCLCRVLVAVSCQEQQQHGRTPPAQILWSKLRVFHAFRKYNQCKWIRQIPTGKPTMRTTTINWGRWMRDGVYSYTQHLDWFQYGIPVMSTEFLICSACLVGSGSTISSFAFFHSPTHTCQALMPDWLSSYRLWTNVCTLYEFEFNTRRRPPTVPQRGGGGWGCS